MGETSAARTASLNAKLRKKSTTRKNLPMSVNFASKGTIALFFLLSALILAGGVAFAHLEENLQGFSVRISPDKGTQGNEVFLEAVVTDENGGPAQGLSDVMVDFRYDDISIGEPVAAKERVPGTYYVSYTPEKAGSYIVHLTFAGNGIPQEASAFLDVAQSPWRTPGKLFLGGTLLLALLAAIFGIVKRSFKNAVIAIIIILAAGGIGYSLYVTIQSGAANVGIVTCLEDGNCILTGHFHAYVPISICGNDLRLPVEKGALTGPHTHEEKNIIHWHDKLPYDKSRGTITDTIPLTLQAFFTAIEIPFDIARLGDTRNGDTCSDGKKGTFSLFLNGAPYSGDPGSFTWKDKDVISIFFDSRPSSEIETWLRNNPIGFPALGRG